MTSAGDPAGGAEPAAVPEVVKAGYAYQALEWQYRLRAQPTGTIPEDWREKALSQMAAARTAAAKTGEGQNTLSAVTWQAIGPDDIGGRIRSIAVDPNDANTVYCGSVGGGVWKSTNAGGSWFPTGDGADNLVIGCIAIDPNNPNIIYAGTGEGYFNYDALRGAGILKSTDAGASWVLLTTFSGTPGGGVPDYINDIYIRSDNSSLLWAATNSGLFRSTNAGGGWSFAIGLNVTARTNRCTQIVGDSSNPATFYVAFGNFSKDGIYKTTNGGTNFTRLQGGFPQYGFFRISMGISRGNPSVLYAVLTDSATYGTHSVQKTTDGGASWAAVTTPMDGQLGGTHLGSQGWYNSVVAVHPTDFNTVYVGGINSFRSTNGGSTWTQMTNGYPSPLQFMHVDQHAMAFDPVDPKIMYFGNDGGMYKTADGGAATPVFQKINSGLAVTQFYSGAAHPSAEIFYGGTQDNGTVRSMAPPLWTETLPGDGGVTYVDFNNPLTVYTEYVYLNFQKSVNAGVSWNKMMTGIPTTAPNSSGTTDRAGFIAPFTMDPSDPQTIIAGTYRVYRTTNGASNWTAISADLTGQPGGAGGVGSLNSVISALTIARSDPGMMYAGTTGDPDTASRIWVTTNTGGSWTNVTKSPLPDRAVTSIAVDPGNPLRAYAAFSGYNANTPGFPGHLFRTISRGVSWTNVSGNLPDVPVNVVVLDTLKPTLHIIVGTDLGVFESTNGGTTWTEQNTGLAKVSVTDLDLRPDGVLVAATHGRGMFRTPGSIITDVETAPAEVPSRHALRQNYPNPFNPVTTIGFDVAVRSEVTLRVFDAAGREVETIFRGERGPGTYSADFDGSARASGVYFYTLEIRTEDGVAAADTKKMLLVK